MAVRVHLEGAPWVTSTTLRPAAACSRTRWPVRTDVARVLRDRYHLEHDTLQVDHVGHGRTQAVALPARRRTDHRDPGA